jgi:hypothetical protein
MITTGKGILTALAGYGAVGNFYYDIAVVDAHSGAVLYFGHVNGGNPGNRTPKITDRAQKQIDKSLKNFPAQNAS